MKTKLLLLLTAILMTACSKGDDAPECECESVRGYSFQNCGEYMGNLENMSDNALEIAQSRNPCQ